MKKEGRKPHGTVVENLMQNHNKTRGITGKYLFQYSLMMMVLFAITFFWFVYYQKGFVWEKDGYSQHYAALMYYGEYLRGIIKNLFIHHRLEIPLWDINIGYGSDIITTLHYYVVGDPLALFSVFVPKVYTEYLYAALVLLRIYLAGLSFSYFSLSHGNRQFPVLLGSACYCFCGYVLKVAIRHPYFMNPMIYLPLLLLGVDRVYQGKKPRLYIAMVALAGISNFYFLYMLGLLVVLYAAARYLEIFHGIKWKEFFCLLGRFVGYSLLGLAMAAVILLPVITSMFQADRVGIDFYLPVFYTDKYYKDLVLNFTSGGGAHFSFLGYSAIGFLAVVSLYCSKGKNALLKILFPVMTVFLCIPYVGHVFNGFSYRTNRWVFGYSMLVAYIVVKGDFFSLGGREKKRLVFFTALYGMVCLCLSREVEVVVKVALLAVCCFCICACGTFLPYRKVCHSAVCREMRRYSPFLMEKGRYMLLLTLFGVCAFFQAFYLYTPAGADYQKEFISMGKCYGMLFGKSSESSVCQVMEEEDAFRFDRSRSVSITKQGNEANINGAMVRKRHGISYYFSLDHPAVSAFLREMQLNITSGHHYMGLDSRNILETVSSVKYFVAGRKKREKVPGFYKNYPVCNGAGCLVYQGKNALPIGYTYDSYIPRQIYDGLSAVKKQQALLQGCVVEDSSLPEAKPLFCHQTASVRIEPGKGTAIEGNQIRVKKKGAGVTLRCQGTVPGELYVIFTGLTYRYKEKHEVRIQFKAGHSRGVLVLKNNKDNFYAGLEDFMVNLGDVEKEVTEIGLTFPNKGNYAFDTLSVVSQPMDRQMDYTEKRGKEVLREVDFSANRISGRISLQEKKLLFLSIPYSMGWRAYVNGEEAKLKQANTFGMAMELAAGEHHVQLVYTTPYLKAGALLSAFGCLVFVAIGNSCYNGTKRGEPDRRKNLCGHMKACFIRFIRWGFAGRHLKMMGSRRTES